MSSCLFQPQRHHVSVLDSADVPVLLHQGTALQWLLIDVAVSAPVDLRVQVTGPAGLEDIWITVARAARICVEATDLRLSARARSGSATVAAGMRADREATANILDVAVAEANSPGVLTPVPARAVSVVLDCPAAERGGAFLEIVDGAGITRGSLPASAVGVSAPIGAGQQVRTICNAPHRVLFHLSL